MEVAVQFLRKLSETWCELSELIRQAKYPGILAIHNGEDCDIVVSTEMMVWDENLMSADRSRWRKLRSELLLRIIISD